MKELLKFVIIPAILILVLSQNIFAQNKVAPPTVIKYSSSSSTNDVKSLTNVQPKEVKFSAEKQNLLSQLEEARSTNNMVKKEQIESQLNQLNGTESVPLIQDPNIHGGAAPVNSEGSNNVDFFSTLVASGGIWASATQTTPTTFPVAGVIWAAANIYNSAGSDTCKFYFSTNGGQNWTFAYYYNFGSNMDFRPGELDLELMYDGTNVWIMGVAGYTDIVNSRTNSVFFRINTTTNTFSGYILSWPGNTTTTNLYYNPRMTSDNSNYTTATYAYLSCSFDSTGASSTHINRQKYAHITNPFVASPTIDYTQNANGGFYWNSSGVAAGSYLWTDIAYFRTSGSVNRIITVYNVPGSVNYNLYLAWSDDFGVTVTGSSSIAETNIDYGARIAFNGGTTNYNGMIAYVRQFSGTDWDPYCRYTTDGGTTWTAGYIDGSSKRTRTVDIVAPRGAANLFKVAYNQDSAANTYAYYTGGNGVTWTLPPPIIVSPAGADTSYTKAIAGFVNGGGNDCITLYSLGGGTNAYASRLCQTVNGIHNNNNEIPKEFSLSQNYPNPFNPSTSIKFSLPKISLVKLTIYDILGNEVEILQNGNMEAGNYIIDFNASKLSSGVYFYKLDAGSFVETKRMLLIK
jgi:hypothetical protein